MTDADPYTGLPLNVKGIRKVTDPLELFTLLFKHAEMEGPQVPVNELITEAKAELFEAICNGSPPECYMQWHRILWDGIEWGEQADEDVDRCSMNIIIFMGHIEQFTSRNHYTAVPLSFAIEVLVCNSDIGETITCGFSRTESRLMANLTTIRELDVQFDMTIHTQADDLDYSEWETNSGII